MLSRFLPVVLVTACMLTSFSAYAMAAGVEEERPVSLDIWERTPGLDSGRLVDEDGTIYSRREARSLLEAEPVSAPLVSAYRAERRRAGGWAVVGLIPLAGVVATPHVLHHAEAAEDALQEALVHYNTFGPAMDAAIEELP